MGAVTIMSRCGIELCEKIEDAEGTVIYADPPYLMKGAKYVHDFATADHKRLADVLRRFKRTRVVVSYYDDPKLDGLYPDWHKVDCTRTKTLVNAGMRDHVGKTVAPEVLLINEPKQTELFA
jgi:DNA adenine methylase